MTDELRLRARMIAAGIWLSVVLLACVGVWIALTWQRPHRGGLIAMGVAAGVTTLIIALVPRERIVLSRWREPFFLAWSLSLIVFVTVAAGLDAGVRSPIVLALFLTLVYAALSYPRWSMSVVSVASLLAVLTLSQIHAPAAGPTNPMYLAGLMLTLAVTGVMCILQTRLQQQAREELSRVSRVDPLTGALNRRGFTEQMSAELSRGARAEVPVALVVLDFNGFKQVNDRDRHAAGDELLCWAVSMMRATLRPEDGLGRVDR
jgi:predicted signal transduction protein with EAL and GGDEF domain